MKRETLFFKAFQMLFTYSLTAQVMGNFQYRTQQVFRQAEVQQTDRRPVTNPRIAHNHEITITVQGLVEFIELCRISEGNDSLPTGRILNRQGIPGIIVLIFARL